MKEDLCFILQPKADNRGSNNPFRGSKVPFSGMVLHTDNYIVRRTSTNETQTLLATGLESFVPHKSVE